MATAVLTLALHTQEDVLLTRRRARDLAALLQLTPAEQAGVSAAVWEVARLAERRGEVELAVVEEAPSVAVRITVSGVPRSVLTVAADGPRLHPAAPRPLGARGWTWTPSAAWSTAWRRATSTAPPW